MNFDGIVMKQDFVRNNDIKESLGIGRAEILKQHPSEGIDKFLKSLNPVYPFTNRQDNESFSNVKFIFVIDSIFNNDNRMSVDWYRNEGHIVINEVLSDHNGDSYNGRTYEHKHSCFYSASDLQKLFYGDFNNDDWIKEEHSSYAERMDNVLKRQTNEEIERKMEFELKVTRARQGFSSW